MWSALVFQDNYYLFNVLINDYGYSIYISDLESIWMTKSEKNGLIEMFKEQNPLLDQTAQEINDSISMILNNEHIVGLTFDDITCNVKFKQFLDELPLTLEILLQKQSSTEFLNHVTIPIVQTIQYLELKQKKLETLLAQKDKELLEYKNEYGNISRKFLETEKYEIDTDTKTCLLLKVFSENDEFSEIFVQKHGDVQKLFPEIREDKKPEKRKLQLAPVKYKRMK